MGLWGAIKRALDGAPKGDSAPPGAPVGLIKEFPHPRRVGATEQALSIIEALQDEGKIGFVSYAEILTRYAEHCLMFGFEPIPHRTLNEAIGEFCERQRPRVGRRQKITGFLIPERGFVPWKHLPNVVTNGNIRPLPVKHSPERVRAGTYAQA